MVITCRFVCEGKRFTARRLIIILKNSSFTIIAPEKYFNEIYITIFKYSISLDYTDEEREDQYRILRYIFKSIIVLFFPLSADLLSTLLYITKEDVDEILKDFYIILDILKDQTSSFYLYYFLFRDFLLDKERCGNLNF